jgi:LacI family transcriptional regulator
MKRRVTLKDIARHAGVATGTVSMVLNNNPLVAESTREHVRRVIKELGYVYHRAAAQLRNQRTGIVAVSTSDLLNPYFAEVAAGMEQVLEEHGRVLVLGNARESVPRQARFLSTLREYNVEGVLLIPAIGTPRAAVEQLMEWHIPLVLVTRYVPGVECDYVGNDNRLGSILATRHLLELGHRRLAFVGYNRRTTTGRDRFAGFRSALKEAGVPQAPELVIECGADRQAGFDGVCRLFAQKRPPTAVVCFNDVLAFGVMLGLRHLKVEIGSECSVVGADDVAESALWLPPVTTVAVDAAGIGRAAAQVLWQRIEDPKHPSVRQILAPTLVIRASSGKAPRAALTRSGT